jgi:Domain of unknown function (DUF4864)
MLRLPVFGLLLSVFMVLAGTAMAHDDPAPDVWQAVITSQIEALRVGDAPTVLGLSDAHLRQSFSDPEQFVEGIRAWGYGPIVDSRAHSFGPFRMLSPGEVVQDVNFVGADQVLFEAQFFGGPRRRCLAGTQGRAAGP